MKVCILERDGESQPRTARSALTRRIRAPEPVKNAFNVIGSHADSMVANSDTDRVL
jgi:hypothetical protein